MQLSDGSPPSRSPPPLRTTSPEYIFSDTTSPMGSEILFGHMQPGMACNIGSTALVMPNTSYVDSSSRSCPECGQTSFSRGAELRRHITEQHRCPHEDCEEVKYVSSKERDDHQRIVHNDRLGHRCGKCLLEGQTPHNLPRLDKLKEHYRKVHHLKENLELLKCKHSACLPSKKYGGLFFCSKEELTKHERISHSNQANPLAMSK